MDTFEYTDSYYPLRSSAISSIHWDAHNFQLAVTFRNGTTVGYKNVSKTTFDDFCSAYSVGHYWNDVFRDDRLSFPRIKFENSHYVDFQQVSKPNNSSANTGEVEYLADVTLTVNAKFNVKAASFADAEKAVLADLENLPVLKNGTYEIEVRSLNKV